MQKQSGQVENCAVLEKIETVVRRIRTEMLSADERLWMQTAVEAAGAAYAPYSQFKVGAVAVLSDGRMVTGNNQENAAYPSGLCAERVALFSAGANRPDAPVKALALIALKDGEIQEAISPCGACRQVLLEAERRQGKPLQVVMFGRREVRIVDSAAALLPLGFAL